MQDATAPKRRCPLWVRIVLALSLALNLAIVGAVVGFVARGGPAGTKVGGIGYAMPYVLSLPKEARRGVFDAVRSDKSLPDRRARRVAYREVVALLSATPFDRDAVEAVLLQQAEGVADVQRVARAAWLDTVSQMSDAERMAYAEEVKAVIERGKGAPRKPKDKDKDKDRD